MKSQLNIKHISYGKVPVSLDIKPNYKIIGKTFGTETGDIILNLD
jgi:hypothetical protein